VPYQTSPAVIGIGKYSQFKFYSAGASGGTYLVAKPGDNGEGANPGAFVIDPDAMVISSTMCKGGSGTGGGSPALGEAGQFTRDGVAGEGHRNFGDGGNPPDGLGYDGFGAVYGVPA